MEQYEIENLIEQAYNSLKYSYSPYSHFCVGASLLTAEGKIFTGCNVENASYGPSNCAERTAVFKAVSEGFQNFKAIAIVGGSFGKVEDYCPPCGVCRQVLSEFCKDDFTFILARNKTEYKLYTLNELLPERFDLEKN